VFTRKTRCCRLGTHGAVDVAGQAEMVFSFEVAGLASVAEVGQGIAPYAVVYRAVLSGQE